jgi:hypothetical protein
MNKKIAAITIYVGYGPEEIEYKKRLQKIAEKEGKTASDLILDAFEYWMANDYLKRDEKYVKKHLPKPPEPLKIPTQKQGGARSIAYDDLEDPPAPRPDPSHVMPSSRPKDSADVPLDPA